MSNLISAVEEERLFYHAEKNLQMLQLTRLRAPVFPSKGEKLGCHINNLSFLLLFPHLHEVEETDETGTVEKASGSVQLSISLPSALLLHQHVAFLSRSLPLGGEQLCMEALGLSGVVLLQGRIGEQPGADRLWGAVPSLFVARRHL